MQERSVILLATNKQRYLNFAFNCARSIMLHNPGLPIFIATNIAPSEEYPGIKFVAVTDEQAKLNIAAKVYLDQLVQTDETLFIDSDCLCYGNLNELFGRCNGHNVTTIGRIFSTLDEWGPQGHASFLKFFGTEMHIIFNGGLYYIKKSVTTTRIFDKARELLNNYDDYGFHRIQNGWVNEEHLFGVAMVLNNETPIPDDAHFMTDLYTDWRPKKLNVLTVAKTR
jgi:hypothetical protein